MKNRKLILLGSIIIVFFLVFSFFTINIKVYGRVFRGEPFYFEKFNTNEPEIEWSQTFGGIKDDGAYSVLQTSDEGYILCGFTRSYGSGSSDIWLIKTDALGNKLWDKTFGSLFGDVGYSIQKTLDGGFIIDGTTASLVNGWDAWLIKTNAVGTKLWDKTFGGEQNDEVYSVYSTSDGNFLLTGMTYSYGTYISTFNAISMDGWLIKIDGFGNKVWDKTFGEKWGDKCYSIKETKNGDYILTGYTHSTTGKEDGWLIKTDKDGNKLWDKTLGGSQNEVGYSIQETLDDGYVIVGKTNSSGAGKDDVWMVKTDSEGNILWEKTYGGLQTDIGYSVQQTLDEGYIIVGKTNSFGAGKDDMWLIKTDKEGNKLWDETFGGIQNDMGYSVQQTHDGNYIIAGKTNSLGAGKDDVWLIKVKNK